MIDRFFQGRSTLDDLANLDHLEINIAGELFRRGFEVLVIVIQHLLLAHPFLFNTMSILPVISTLSSAGRVNLICLAANNSRVWVV